MKRLVDAFLELPTWQGGALITAVMVAVIYAGWRIFWLGYRIGQRDADREKYLIATNPRVWREHPASRVTHLASWTRRL
jgi:hypothetical protein